MIEAELTAARTGETVRAQAGSGGEPVATLPPQPKTVRESGLELPMLVELTAKAMYSGDSMYWSCSCVARKLSAARCTSGPTS